MDGTLLGADSKVSPQTAAIISDLTRRGALITVATARTPATVVPLLADTLTTPPAIVMTGAAMWLRDAARYDSVHIIPRDERCHIIQVCHGAGLHPFIYVMDGDSMLTVYHDGDSLTPVERDFYQARAHLPLKQFRLHCPVPENSSAVLCYAMGHHEGIFAAAATLRGRQGLSLSCYYDIFDRNIAHLEIFAAGVSKASAVTALKARLGAERVVVFGDNLNDLPMMQVADCSVAVGNAFDEVKAAADIVIGPNTADSVARFIQSDFLNRQA
ncbi:MAG: Cof-type HAD-IIB family hydrolase [Muribaculaceae bacterium]|nr:Cof-type HAD-IIB family hydrolase [Muribaculaceae bacterium]